MVKFRLEPNGVIYLYHWATSKLPIKISTRIKIDSTEWNKDKMRPNSVRYKYKGKNVTAELVRIEAIYYKVWNYFQETSNFTPIKLKQKFKELLSSGTIIPSQNENPRFLEFFSQLLEEYKITMKRDSWKGYNTTLTHLKDFFGRNIPNFEDIDMSFYRKYNKFLIGKDLAVNTISTQWKFIKAVMKQAQNEKLHNNNDFQMFKRTQEATDSIYLTVEEIKDIYDLKLIGYQDKARDYFLIGCYTGLRYEDWHLLTNAKIKDGIATIINSKTGERSYFKVANNVMRILNKYKDGVLPTKPSNQKMNKYIKEIAEKAKITEPIEKRITKGGKVVVDLEPKCKRVSTHTARRSFATISILNGVPPHLVMTMTGHKTLPSFEKYIRFDDLQAAIQLKESASFKDSFGEALTRSEKFKHDPEFRKQQTKLLLL